MEVFQQLQQLPPFARDMLRLCIWFALLMIIFVPSERLCAQRPQKVFRTGFLTDAGYYFISSLLPARLLVLPTAAIAWGLHYVVPDGLHQWTASLPFGARFAAALFVGDFGSYWVHRWMHEIPLLWRFHAVHHSAGQMDWLVNTRAHPVDMTLNRLGGIIPMYALGLIQPVNAQADPMLLLVILFGTVWGFFIHANLRWRFGWLEWLIATPAFHHWHHTNDGLALINKNYAATLPVMDLLFGSFYLPKKQWPASYGIDGEMSPSLAGQLVQPFWFRQNP